MTLPNETTPDLTAAAGAAATRMPATSRAADAVFLLDETESTNTLARELIADGRLGVDLSAGAVSGSSTSSDAGRPSAAVPVAVIAADAQTAGRGRLDHTWQSRPGESFTVTFVVAVPRAVATDESVNGWLQMIAGLAAIDAIDDAVAICGARPLRGDGSPAVVDGDGPDGPDDPAGPDDSAGPVVFADPHRRSVAAPAETPQLKWPNDIYLGGRKLGGILAELVPLSAVGNGPAAGRDDGCGVVGRDAAFADVPASAGSEPSVAIVFGIGLNLAVPADRLPTPESTSLQLHYAPLPGPDALRDAIAAGVVRSLRRRLSAFVADPRRRAAVLLRETRERSWTLGRRAVAHFVDGAELEGVAEDLNPDASLVLRDRDGAEHTVRTADVGVLPERDV